MTMSLAIKQKSFHPKPGDDLVVGDAEAAILSSAHVIRGFVDMETQYHFTMETQACAVIPTDIGYDVHATTQYPGTLFEYLIQLL